MTTLKAGTVVEVRPQGFVKGVMVVKGPTGDPGSPGDPGPANSLTIGTVTTSDPGSSAAATVTGTAPDQTLNLTIPRGAAGPTTDIAIGTVTTGAPGTDASATISGTAPDLTLDMTIPRGTPGAGSVDSVNGDPGPDIVLDAADVGARPAGDVPWGEVSGKPSTFAPSAHTHTEADITGLTADLSAKVDNTEVGVANGVASLDSAGKIPASQLPSSVMEYKGTWNASTNSPALADGTGDPGDQYKVNVAGTRNLGSGNQTFVVGDWVVYNGTIWEQSHGGADAVQSVAGLTGTITSAGLKTALAIAQSDVSGLTTALSGKQDTSAKGAANGYASLGSDGLVPSSQLPSSTSSAPLARTAYNFTAGSTTTISPSSATATSDADATNLAVTFTAPTSGKVRIALEGTVLTSSGSGYQYWSLRSGTTDISGSERLAGAPGVTSARVRARIEIALSGLTPGASLTYKWALRGAAATLALGTTTEFGNTNGNYGPAIMTVFAE